MEIHNCETNYIKWYIFGERKKKKLKIQCPICKKDIISNSSQFYIIEQISKTNPCVYLCVTNCAGAAITIPDVPMIDFLIFAENPLKALKDYCYLDVFMQVD